VEADAEAPRRGRRPELVVEAEVEDAVEADEEEEAEEVEAEGAAAESEDRDSRRRRRRGRRGGRRRRDGEADGAEAREGGDAEAAPAAKREPREDREERGGRNRRRRRGRGRSSRRVYEVDGGEWLDFVSADLKHLAPRAPRPAPTAAAAAAPARVVEDEPSTADIIVHPAADPAPEFDVTEAPEPALETVEAVTHVDPAETLNYEPDQERRDKFLSRFSRWAKKGG
jgi:ribonuclease E